MIKMIQLLFLYKDKIKNRKLIMWSKMKRSEPNIRKLSKRTIASRPLNKKIIRK